MKCCLGDSNWTVSTMIVAGVRIRGEQTRYVLYLGRDSLHREKQEKRGHALLFLPCLVIRCTSNTLCYSPDAVIRS